MPADLKQYHPKWKQISFFIRFCCYDGKCQFCGAQHGKAHPETGSLVKLQCAHRDQRIENVAFSNLMALCPRCHLNYDRQASQPARKYGRDFKRVNLSLPF